MVERHGWMIGAAGTAIAVVLVMALTVAPLAGIALAQSHDVTEIREEGVDNPPADEIERWWGVAGAVICAYEVRLIIRAPAIGMNPYALAAGIAGCSLAMLDIVTST